MDVQQTSGESFDKGIRQDTHESCEKNEVSPVLVDDPGQSFVIEYPAPKGRWKKRRCGNSGFRCNAKPRGLNAVANDSRDARGPGFVTASSDQGREVRALPGDEDHDRFHGRQCSTGLSRDRPCKGGAAIMVRP